MTFVGTHLGRFRTIVVLRILTSQLLLQLMIRMLPLVTHLLMLLLMLSMLLLRSPSVLTMVRIHWNPKRRTAHPRSSSHALGPTRCRPSSRVVPSYAVAVVVVIVGRVVGIGSRGGGGALAVVRSIIVLHPCVR
jgi:hypothetical protein